MSTSQAVIKVFVMASNDRWIVFAPWFGSMSVDSSDEVEAAARRIVAEGVRRHREELAAAMLREAPPDEFDLEIIQVDKQGHRK